MRTSLLQGPKPALLRLCMAVVAGTLIATSTAADPHSGESRAPGTIEFVGKNLIATANGSFHDWKVVDSQIDLDSPADSFAVVEVQLASVDTGIGRRDDHLRNPDFFEVDTYPVATARLHSPRAIVTAEDAAPRYSVQIDLDLHGVQKTLEGELTLKSRSPLVVEGSVEIDRTAFQVGPAPSRWNPMTPRASIPVRFRVEL